MAKEPGSPSLRRWVLLGLLALGAGMVLLTLLVAGVAAVALVDRLEGPEVWNRWSEIGDSFGVLNGVVSGLAFAALMATLWFQSRELSLQRFELRMQRDAIRQSGEELRRTADAGMRNLHFELLKMSIQDAALADVWPDPVPTSDETRRRQLLYANLVFQHLALSMTLAEHTDDEAREALRYIFESELMREYWLLAAPARRKTQVSGSGPSRMSRLADEVLAEFSATRPGAEQQPG
ncbi:DUF6082 family protein [Dactylosporangium sp. NPDC049140]|uniref:DUF6082 family protein n=1 Tax=Dactylosporangium sp. NPDC049140 TaxID=3155647 RepID=UPI003400DC1E